MARQGILKGQIPTTHTSIACKTKYHVILPAMRCRNSPYGGLDAMTQDTCHDREATAELDALRRRVAELESATADFQRDLAEYGEQAERYRIISELTSDYVYAMGCA